MINIKLKTRVFEKKKGTSTEVTAYSPLGADAMLTIKVDIDGRINQDRQSSVEKFVIRAVYKLHSDDGLKDIV
ncbi:hypothetical protein AP064_05155 [Candidatus Liberibacter solanacearum]|nr:hypothetical protein AP064_05155 [Candidatus Liberibacter solanacearum]